MKGVDYMPVYKTTDATKDGRCWCFRIRYKALNGKSIQYHSKKYATKKAAIAAEAEFILKSSHNTNIGSLTVKDLIDLFIENRNNNVKETTFYNYRNKICHLEPLHFVKLEDLNIEVFEHWKSYLNNKKLSLKYKNEIYKFFKSLLNFGTQYYDYNFSNLYNKMIGFKDPDAISKEMLFFTYDEFQKFIATENDFKYQVIFKLFYFCGLRLGELRGLQWKDINFTDKTLSVTKQIHSHIPRNNWHFSNPKTKKSIRALPITKCLMEDLEKLWRLETAKKDFNLEWFVAADSNPIATNTLRDRKNANCASAHVKQIRLHDFRHSCASLLIHMTPDVHMVAKYLGHTKIDETLNTYSHLYSRVSMANIVNIMDNLDKNSLTNMTFN